MSPYVHFSRPRDEVEGPTRGPFDHYVLALSISGITLSAERGKQLHEGKEGEARKPRVRLTWDTVNGDMRAEVDGEPAELELIHIG